MPCPLGLFSHEYSCRFGWLIVLVSQSVISQNRVHRPGHGRHTTDQTPHTTHGAQQSEATHGLEGVDEGEALVEEVGEEPELEAADPHEEEGEEAEEEEAQHEGEQRHRDVPQPHLCVDRWGEGVGGWVDWIDDREGNAVKADQRTVWCVRACMRVKRIR